MNPIHPIAAHHAAVSVMAMARYIADRSVAYKTEIDQIIGSIQRLTDRLATMAEAEDVNDGQRFASAVTVLGLADVMASVMEAATVQGIQPPAADSPEVNGLNEFGVILDSVTAD